MDEDHKAAWNNSHPQSINGPRALGKYAQELLMWPRSVSWPSKRLA